MSTTTLNRFAQEQASKIYAYVKVKPLVLSALALPLILLSTMAIAGTIDTNNLLPASAVNIEVDTAALKTDSSDAEEVSEKIYSNPFGAGGNRYEGEAIQFAYPATWALDSLEVVQSPGHFVIAKNRGDAAISISVRPASEWLKDKTLSGYLVDKFRSEPTYERYFLRQLVPLHIGRTTVEQVQYATVISTFLSEEGLKSERGIKAAFVSSGDQLITVDLQTSYDNSFGNYLQVDGLKPIMYDIIGSILSVDEI